MQETGAIAHVETHDSSDGLAVGILVGQIYSGISIRFWGAVGRRAGHRAPKLKLLPQSYADEGGIYYTDT